MSSEARKGAIYNYINLLLINATGVILTPFIIRCLGTSQYGLYTLIGAVVPYIALFDWGMSKTVTRYVAHYRSRRESVNEARFLTTAIIIYAFIVVLMVLCGILLYTNTEHIWGKHFTATELEDVRQMILLTTVTQAIIIPGNIFTAICNGSGNFAFPRGIQPIKYAIRAICVVCLLIYGIKAIALIAVEAILNVCVVIATCIYVKCHIGRRDIFSSQRMAIRPIVHYTQWIGMYAATCVFQWTAGNIIAGMTHDTTAVGVMGIGVLLGSMYGYFAETINRMTMPHATRFVRTSPGGASVTDEMIRVGRMVAIPQIGILGGFIIFGNSFVRLWAGETYTSAYHIALVMMSASTIQLSQEYGTSLLEAKGSVRSISVINFICIFAGVVASYFIAQQHSGIEYIIYALAGGTLLATTANNIYYRHKLHLDNTRYFREVYGRLLLSTSMAVAIYKVIEHYCITQASWWWIAIGGTTYAALYIILIYKVILTGEERRLLTRDAR